MIYVKGGFVPLTTKNFLEHHKEYQGSDLAQHYLL